MTSSRDSLDEILLVPAHWQLDDYKKARKQLNAYILDEIIGADEALPPFDKEADSFERAERAEILARNDLKAEQRLKLKGDIDDK